MADQKNIPNVVTVLDLNAASARKILDQICRDTSRIFIVKHAEERMVTRNITRVQVIKCLRHGVIIEGPYRECKSGNWRLKLESRSSGDTVRVVAELDTDEDGNYVLIITTF